MTVAEVTATGVDSVSFAFRPEGRGLFSVVDAFRRQPHRHGPAGSLIAEQRSVDGGRLLLFPARGVLAVESRLAALLAANPDDHGLCSVSSLPSGAEVARRALGTHLDHDLVGEHVEVRRIDLASELRFGAAPDGLAFLRSVAALAPARMITDTYRAVDGSVMTVYARTPGRGVVTARIYDKGRESGSDPPGRRVRIESQIRPVKSQRQSPDVVASLDLSERFGRTMKPYLSENELVVAGPDGAVADLAAKAINGEMTHARAERLIGSVALLKYGGRAVYDSVETGRKVNDRRSSRRLKALRDAGVVLSDELPPASVVPVSALLRDAIERFTA